MRLATLRYPRGGRGRHGNRPPPRPPEEPASGRTHHHHHPHHHSAPSPVPTTSARHPLLFVPQLVGVASLVCLLAPALPPSTAELDPELSFWGPSAISKELSLAIEAAAGQGRPRGGRIRALRARGKGGVEGWVIRITHTHRERERAHERASERVWA